MHFRLSPRVGTRYGRSWNGRTCHDKGSYSYDPYSELVLDSYFGVGDTEMFGLTRVLLVSDS